MPTTLKMIYLAHIYYIKLYFLIHIQINTLVIEHYSNTPLQEHFHFESTM